MCADANRRDFKNEVYPDSFLSHFYAGTWFTSDAKISDRLLKVNETVSILDVIPDLVKVSDKLGLKCEN